MPKITYHHPDGTATPIEVAEQTSVMRAALLNNVAGIIGECGGQAMCATCHVFVRSEIDLAPPSDDEDEMLDCTTEERQDCSRLSCQLVAGRDFDSIDVEIPLTQN